MKRISALCLLALAPAIGMASIIPTSTAVTATGTGTFKWSYGLSLASDQNVNGGFLPITTTIVPRENAGRGGFLTLYDFEGYVAGSCTSPAGWTCSVQKLGYTPDDVAPIDNPLFDNRCSTTSPGSTPPVPPSSASRPVSSWACSLPCRCTTRARASATQRAA